MGIQKKFAEYIQAFEESYEDDDWSRLTKYFTPAAVYLTGDGQKVSGRANIIFYLKESVENFDRQFNLRVPVFDDLIQTDNIMSTTWTFTYKMKDAPDLVTSGIEIAEFEDHTICQLRSNFDEGVMERSQEWFKEHGKKA